MAPNKSVPILIKEILKNKNCFAGQCLAGETTSGLPCLSVPGPRREVWGDKGPGWAWAVLCKWELKHCG